MSFKLLSIATGLAIVQATPWGATWPSLEDVALVYAPFVPGVDGYAEDLYSNIYSEHFRRDARVMSTLGVPTLMLEAWTQAASYHQALYNATRPELIDIDTAHPTLEDIDDPTSRPLAVIPAFPLAAPSGEQGDVWGPRMLRRICRDAATRVRFALRPAPAQEVLAISGSPYGGGHDDSKNLTKAFNLQVMPNDVQKWGLMSRVHAIDRSRSIFVAIEEMARCTRQAAERISSRGPVPQVLLSILDNPCILTDAVQCRNDTSTAAGFVNRYHQWLEEFALTSKIDGFVVQVSRARGCSAKSLVESVGSAASLFARRAAVNITLWFAVGVDAYDDARQGPYPISLFDGSPAETAFADVRTECLLNLIGSVDRSCGAMTNLAAVAQDDVHCNVAVAEYADSLWRAGYAGWGDAATERNEDCGQRWSGTEATAFLYEQLTCAVQATCSAFPPGLCQGHRSLQDFSVPGVGATDPLHLPAYLQCDPNATNKYDYHDARRLPYCQANASTSLDSWWNVAYDGLMEPAPVQEWICEPRYSVNSTALRPRRAFYSLQQVLSPPYNRDVILLQQLPDSNTSGTSLGVFGLKGYRDVWTGATLMYLLVFLLLLAVFKSIHRGFLQKQGWDVSSCASFAVLSSLVVMQAIIYSDAVLPTHCLMSGLVSDMLVLVFVVFVWCSMGGGGGNGDWWWPHFLLAGMYLTFLDAQPWQGFRYECESSPLVNALWSVLRYVAVRRTTQSPLKAPPWDVCQSAACCVRLTGSNGGYFPWSSEVPVPSLWEPFITWKRLEQMLGPCVWAGFIVLTVVFIPKPMPLTSKKADEKLPKQDFENVVDKAIDYLKNKYKGDFREGSFERVCKLTREFGQKYLERTQSPGNEAVQYLEDELLQGVKQWLQGCPWPVETFSLGSETQVHLIKGVDKLNKALGVYKLNKALEGETTQTDRGKAIMPIVQLSLLVGAENFFRATPNCIGLLTALYWGVDDDDQERAEKERDLLKKFQKDLFRLHERAGGTEGGRVPDLMTERFMNFDDLNELCAGPNLGALFAAIEGIESKHEGRYGMKGDAHKTFSELRGYSSLLVSTSWLWRTLLLGLFAVVIHDTGGYAAWLTSTSVLSYFRLTALDSIFESLLNSTDGVPTPVTGDAGGKYVPMSFKYYLILVLVNNALNVIFDCVKLSRIYRISNKAEEEMWSFAARATKFRVSSVSCMSKPDADRQDAGPDADRQDAGPDADRQDAVPDKMPCQGTCDKLTRELTRELTRLFVTPLRYAFLSFIFFLLTLFWSTVGIFHFTCKDYLSRWCGSRKTRNDCSQKKLWASWSDGQAVVPAFIVTIFRLIWLGVMVLSYHGPRGGEAFVLLASIQGVKDVVGSIIEAAYSVRRRPREGQWTWRAVRLYHKLVEPSWSHLIPCDRRPLSHIRLSSIFWVMVLVLKFGVSFEQLKGLAKTFYNISRSRSLFVAGFEGMVQYYMMWLIFCLRALFTSLLLVSDLQLWFAAMLALAGGCQAAVDKIFPKGMGSLFDKRRDLQEGDLEACSKELWNKCPVQLWEGDDTGGVHGASPEGTDAAGAAAEFGPRTGNMKFFQELWNRGLLKDLRRSDAISDDQYKKLQINASEGRFPDINFAVGSRESPTDEGLRRIHAFMLTCRRPMRPPPAYMNSTPPSLSVIVPAYTETIITGWDRMYTPAEEDGLLTRFEYLVLTHADEFRNFVERVCHSKHSYAKKVLKEHWIDETDSSGRLQDVHGLREKLSMSDYWYLLRQLERFKDTRGDSHLEVVHELLNTNPCPEHLEMNQLHAAAWLKLELRKWCSKREQTMFRTLSGLKKIKEAMKAMQAAAGVVEPARDFLDVEVKACFQIYSKWWRVLLNRNGQHKERMDALDKLLAVHECVHEHVVSKERPGHPDPQLSPKTCVADFAVVTLAEVTNNSQGQPSEVEWFSQQSTPEASASASNTAEQGATSAPSASASNTEDVSSSMGNTVDVCNLMGEIFSFKQAWIPLPGNPIIKNVAEGKPINQISGLLHCTKELVMVNDMNMDADLEQWFFLPRLLAEFSRNWGDGKDEDGLDGKVAIVGFRENIYTEGDGLVGRMGALTEFVFGTIIQRQLQKTLNSRLHYGHPDIFYHPFVLSQGGLSKPSKSVNVSEDLFGGVNAFARGYRIEYVDYMQMSKGRDVQFDAAMGFETKIACGTAMFTLSRDYWRLMKSPLTFFHKASLFSGTIGIFFSDLTLTLSIVVLVQMQALSALLPDKVQVLLSQDTPAYVSLFSLGFVYLFALLVQTMGERGLKGALVALVTVVACIPLAIFKVKAHAVAVHRGMALGVAKYIGTGRDLPVQRVTVVQTFRKYSYSHLAPAVDAGVLILIARHFEAVPCNISAAWLVVGSWFLSPFVYNPFAFLWGSVVKDIKEWSNWITKVEADYHKDKRKESFQYWLFGTDQGNDSEKDLSINNWYCWINYETFWMKLAQSLMTLALWGGVTLLVSIRVTFTVAADVDNSDAVLASGSIVLFSLSVPLAYVFFLVIGMDPKVLKVVSSYALFLMLLGFLITGAIYEFFLFLYALGKAFQAILQLAVLFYATTKPWGDYLLGIHRLEEPKVKSTDMLVNPRKLKLLDNYLVKKVAMAHAWLQALLIFSFQLTVAGVLSLPLLPVCLSLVVWGFLSLCTLVLMDEVTTARAIGLVALVLLPIWVFKLYMVEYGNTFGKLRKAGKALLYSLELRTLHDLFVLNGRVALDLYLKSQLVRMSA